ncbi:unnamed protein product [Phytophthora fragariaefolia]|uniref:Unnamed protein product n=1 Tax=Phytophthora fragariaefolia TaxID=1490495 RepID=A0A9W7CP53_9STRA|nr:unnamed protein product [Phytophthora fragariaefolia]
MSLHKEDVSEEDDDDEEENGDYEDEEEPIEEEEFGFEEERTPNASREKGKTKAKGKAAQKAPTKNPRKPTAEQLAKEASEVRRAAVEQCCVASAAAKVDGPLEHARTRKKIDESKKKKKKKSPQVESTTSEASPGTVDIAEVPPSTVASATSSIEQHAEHPTSPPRDDTTYEDDSSTRHVDIDEAIPTQSQEYGVLNSDCEDTETKIGFYDDDEKRQRTKATNGDETADGEGSSSDEDSSEHATAAVDDGGTDQTEIKPAVDDSDTGGLSREWRELCKDEMVAFAQNDGSLTVMRANPAKFPPDERHSCLYSGDYGPTAEVLQLAESPLDLSLFFMPKKFWRQVAKESNRYFLHNLTARVDRMYEKQRTPGKKSREKFIVREAKKDDILSPRDDACSGLADGADADPAAPTVPGPLVYSVLPAPQGDVYLLVVTDKFYTSGQLAFQLLQRNVYVLYWYYYGRSGRLSAGNHREKSRSTPAHRAWRSANGRDTKLCFDDGASLVGSEIRPVSGDRGKSIDGNLPYVHDTSWCSMIYSYHANRLLTGRSTGGTGGRRQVVPCPSMVRDYHRWMGGVDIHDQLRLQRCSLQLQTWCKKYYTTIFMGLVDVAIVNAYANRAAGTGGGKKRKRHETEGDDDQEDEAEDDTPSPISSADTSNHESDADDHESCHDDDA